VTSREPSKEAEPPPEPTKALAEWRSTVIDQTGAGAPAGDRPRLDPPEDHRFVQRLRNLAGRKTSYQGRIIGITQGWMSRDGDFHVFAARYLDFAMLTDEHLVCFSTGFLSRRPRRRVFREPLNALVVIPRGDEPFRTLRIVGDFNRPLLFELRSDPNSLAFARELVARSREAVRMPANLLSAKKPKRLRKGKEPKAIEAPKDAAAPEETSGAAETPAIEATGEQPATS
jgi:hypothetical protein